MNYFGQPVNVTMVDTINSRIDDDQLRHVTIHVISKNPSPDQKFADSTINIHVHVHVDYEFPRQVETCDNTCDIKKTQPGSKIQKNSD